MYCEKSLPELSVTAGAASDGRALNRNARPGNSTAVRARPRIDTPPRTAAEMSRDCSSLEMKRLVRLVLPEKKIGGRAADV